MVLSDNQILQRLDKDLHISHFNRENLNPCSYDLTISPEITIYQNSVLDCKSEQKTIVRPMGSSFVLKPNMVYIAHCVEHLKIPRNLRATLSGKSSLGRLGLLIHLTAGFIDPGFEGSLVLELACIQPLIIYPFMKIGQIEFMDVYDDVIEDYSQKPGSKYQNQQGSQTSKFHLNYAK